VKRIYLAANLPDAQVVADTLGTQGIRAHIFNAHAVGGAGELAAQQWPEVWVEEDRLAELALSLVRQLDSTKLGPEKSCPACGEKNPANFLSCWNCQRELV
jgi:hypothetical protein